MLLPSLSSWLSFLHLVNIASTINSFSLHPRAFRPRSSNSQLYDGRGVAQTYSWNEDAVELEIRVPVPRDTRANDIIFECRPRSIGLKVIQTVEGHADDDQQQLVLLPGNRTLRGTIAMDGTFWNLEDYDDDDAVGPKDCRLVVVTIEKQMRPPRDDFEVLDYDWGGVYPDDEAEVLERTYTEPEELNLKEYAASLGVDIDNIDMSLVNKTMFSSGLNITQSTMQELEKKGLVKEVTQQGDGSEYSVDDDGDSVPFSPYGTGISREEIEAARLGNRPSIPFLDTDSSWKTNQQSTIQVDDLLKDVAPEANRASTSPEALGGLPVYEPDKTTTEINEHGVIDARTASNDPIGDLTVNRLKEMLREEGLKVTGNKEELRQRLRNHVQSQSQLK